MSKAELEHIILQENTSFVLKAHDYPHPQAKWHYHQEYEIHLLQHVPGKAFIGDYIGDFTPGDVFMVGPNLPHSWISEISSAPVSERDLVIQFSHSLIEQMTAVFAEVKTLDHLFERSQSGLLFTGDTALKVSALIHRGLVTTPLKRLPLLLELLIVLAEAPLNQSRALARTHDFPRWGEKATRKINRITQALQQRYTEPLTVGTLATEFAMTQPTLSRFFKKHTGHNITAYINKLRIGKACERLVQWDKPIATIAFSVGYNSLSHFNQCFQREMGMTARQYRKQHPH